MESSSTRGRSSSPTGRPASPHSSASSSTSSVITGLNAVRPSSSSASSIQNLGGGLESRSVSLNRSQSDSIDIGARYGAQIQNGFGSGELLSESIDVPRAGDSISVTTRFSLLSDREFQRGDEVCWYSDVDKIVRNEYNPATAYAFGEMAAPGSMGKEQIFGMAEKEMEYRVELFNKRLWRERLPCCWKLEQQQRLSVRDLTNKFEKGVAAAAKLSSKAKLRELTGKHVLLKNLRDSLEPLKARVAGRNKDEVGEAINRCI